MLVKLKSMQTAIRSDSKVSAAALGTHLQSHDHIISTKRMLYRVKAELGGEDARQYVKSFYLLEPWVQEFNKLNEANAEVLWDANNRFQGIFIYNKLVTKILKHSAQDVFFRTVLS